MFTRSIQFAAFALATCVAFTTGQAQAPDNDAGFDVSTILDAMSESADVLEAALEAHGGDTSDPLFQEEIDRIANLIFGLNYLTGSETVPIFKPVSQAIDGYKNQGDASYISIAFVVYLVRGAIATAESQLAVPPSFIRADSNGDGLVDIADVVHGLSYLYLGDEKPGCLKAADSNDDGALDVADPVKTLWDLFLTGSPDPNFGLCVRDETPDSLSCEVSSCR